MAPVILPSEIESFVNLRTALNTGAIQSFDGFIAGAFVDGVNVGDEWPRAVASSITYTVILADPNASVDGGMLEQIVPASRIGSNIRIIGPKRLTPCKVLIVTTGSSSRALFYPWTPEQRDPHDCDGNPVLEVD